MYFEYDIVKFNLIYLAFYAKRHKVEHFSTSAIHYVFILNIINNKKGNKNNKFFYPVWTCGTSNLLHIIFCFIRPKGGFVRLI